MTQFKPTWTLRSSPSPNHPDDNHSAYAFILFFPVPLANLVVPSIFLRSDFREFPFVDHSHWDFRIQANGQLRFKRIPCFILSLLDTSKVVYVLQLVLQFLKFVLSLSIPLSKSVPMLLSCSNILTMVQRYQKRLRRSSPGITIFVVLRMCDYKHSIVCS